MNFNSFAIVSRISFTLYKVILKYTSIYGGLCRYILCAYISTYEKNTCNFYVNVT